LLRRWITAAIAIFLGLSTPSDRPYQTAPKDVESTENFYSPNAEDFRAEFRRAPVSRNGQTWEQYWSWVQTFYNGNRLADGWTTYCSKTLAAVKANDQRRAIVGQTNELGKIISREWAKDASLGKIKTADLFRWNDVIVRARRSDDGHGRAIMKAIQTVRADAERLIGR
jgi:hypothetical protein